jgi:hypothetical protein
VTSFALGGISPKSPDVPSAFFVYVLESGAPFVYAVLGIVFLSSHEQVLGITAGFIIAFMANAKVLF